MHGACGRWDVLSGSHGDNRNIPVPGVDLASERISG